MRAFKEQVAQRTTSQAPGARRRRHGQHQGRRGRPQAPAKATCFLCDLRGRTARRALLPGADRWRQRPERDLAPTVRSRRRSASSRTRTSARRRSRTTPRSAARSSRRRRRAQGHDRHRAQRQRSRGRRCERGGLLAQRGYMTLIPPNGLQPNAPTPDYSTRWSTSTRPRSRRSQGGGDRAAEAPAARRPWRRCRGPGAARARPWREDRSSSSGRRSTARSRPSRPATRRSTSRRTAGSIRRSAPRCCSRCGRGRASR